jgi:glycerol-3-phosphate dehydrogenase
LPYVLAEVRFAVERELARSIGDVLVRRTHVAYETEDHGAGAAERVAGMLAEMLEWTPERRADELLRWHWEMSNVFGVTTSAIAALEP